HRVRNRFELLDRQVHEAHDEPANRQSMRDDEDSLGFTPNDLAHHALEEPGRPVVAVGRTFSAVKTVVERAMLRLQRTLAVDANVPMIDFAELRILIYLGRRPLEPSHA